MAQQTRIDQMLPYFEKFQKRFPHIQSLAEAEYEELLKYWEGLGYYSRARNLHHAAKTIVEKHKGELPKSKAELEELKGFGPYIAAAVASIAFNENVPVVDGNVLRVVARIKGLHDDIALPTTRKKFEQLLKEEFPNGYARAFNQGLMELGALICIPENPLCGKCPLQKECIAFNTNQQNILPIKTKKGKTPTKHFAAILLRSNDKILLRKRDEKLLHGMWELPMSEYIPLTDSSTEIAQKMHAKYGLSIRLGKELFTCKNQYSHFTQIAHVFEAFPRGVLDDSPSSMRLLAEKEMELIPLSKTQHLINQQLQGQSL